MFTKKIENPSYFYHVSIHIYHHLLDQHVYKKLADNKILIKRFIWPRNLQIIKSTDLVFRINWFFLIFDGHMVDVL